MTSESDRAQTHPEALALMIEDKITEALVEYDDDRGMTEAEYITRALFDLFEVREEHGAKDVWGSVATDPAIVALNNGYRTPVHRYTLTTDWELTDDN